MDLKVWNITIETILVTTENTITPDGWPLKDLLKRIAEQGKNGSIEVVVSATEYGSPAPTLPIEAARSASADPIEQQPLPLAVDVTSNGMRGPTLHRRDRIRSVGLSRVVEFFYRSEGYTRLASLLGIGTLEPMNTSGRRLGVWLTLDERTEVRAEHQKRYPKGVA